MMGNVGVQRLDFADFSGLRPGSCSVSTAAREASFSDVLGAQLVAKVPYTYAAKTSCSFCVPRARSCRTQKKKKKKKKERVYVAVLRALQLQRI